MAHRLLSACPPQVRLLVTDQGPNTLSPTYVKGGQTLRRSDGRSAMCFSSSFPCSLRQVMHLWSTDLISDLPPKIHSPAALTAPSVR